MPATPVYQLPYPAPADPADVPLDMQELAERIEAVARQFGIGQELGYAEITSQFNITATSSATAQQAIALPAISFDGSTRIVIEFGAGAVTPGNVASSTFGAALYDGSTLLGVFGYIKAPAAIAAMEHAFYARRFLTPAAGSRTYSVRCFVLNGGTGAAIFAGTGASGSHNPAFLRASRLS